jgi:hypothetical protein
MPPELARLRDVLEAKAAADRASSGTGEARRPGPRAIAARSRFTLQLRPEPNEAIMTAATLTLPAAAAALVAAGPGGDGAARALVAKAVNALAAPGGGEGALRPGTHVWENGVGESSAAALARYARQCPLKRVERSPFVTPDASEIPVSVSWACRGRKAANEAIFMVREGRIVSVSFRPIPIVRR